ncbi:hypothetical protein GQ457_14G010920 [Hibiscus cannabinus]
MMNSTTSKFSDSENGINFFHTLFHVNTSPLVQLKACFLAPAVTAAHICCSASTRASDMSQKCSHVYRLPTYRNDNARVDIK